jgi:serine/threonine protein kinase
MGSRLTSLPACFPRTPFIHRNVDRFRQEAQLIANLRHPNIVQVYDFGGQDGFIYHETLAITAQLAGALDAAHGAPISVVVNPISVTPG